MEEDKAYPNSQPPSPLPGWLEGQALSGQRLGAVGSSVLPLSQTEEEGACVTTEQEWEHAVDEELSPRAGVSGRQLCLWEEVAVRQLHRRQEEVPRQEVCPWGAVRPQELQRWQVRVRVQWADGSQQELSQWADRVTAQEVHRRDGDEEVPRAETRSPVPAPRSRPGRGQALLDAACRSSREPGSKAGLQVPGSGQQPEEQRQLEPSVAARDEAAAAGERGESPISGPHSPCCPPSPSPSPRGAQGWSEQQEEAKRGSVGAEQESEEGALTGDLEFSQRDGEEEPELSRGETQQQQQVTPGQACAEPELSPGDAGISQELSDWDEGLKQELSQGESGSDWDFSVLEEHSKPEPSQAEVKPSPAVSGSDECTEQELAREDIGSCPEFSDSGEYLEKRVSPLEVGSYDELSDWDVCSEQELSQEEARSYQELSDWEEDTKQGLLQGAFAGSSNLSHWEEQSQQELSPRDVGSCREHLDWEERRGQELPEEQGSSAQEAAKGNAERRASVQSSWEDDSDREPAQDSGEHASVRSTALVALPREDDEWDDVSVLELHEEGEEARQQRLAGLARDGLSVPVPREAWVESWVQALESCPPEPLYAMPDPLEAQTPVEYLSSPASAEQVPAAGPESPGPAPHGRPGPSPGQPGAQAPHGQRAPPRKRPSRFRRVLRALRGLFRCPCLAAQPED